MITAYCNDETPICNGAPEMGGLGPDRAVEEGLECRIHGEWLLQGLAVPNHTTNPSIVISWQLQQQINTMRSFPYALQSHQDQRASDKQEIKALALIESNLHQDQLKLRQMTKNLEL